jgi:NADH-quinone oxidoreductase subunit L
MTIPLIVLAALSLLGGLMIANDWIIDFLQPVVGVAEHETPAIPVAVTTVLILVVALSGVALAWFLVGKRDVPRTAPQDVSFATRAAREELYGNQVNDALVVNPGRHTVTGVLAFDKYGVDGTLTGGPVAIGAVAQVARRVQNGYVRSYALSLLVGALIVVLALLAVNLA